ncbi:MAG TPA: NADPH dehydrogenase, partial [Firmicutes bacterium]|nr:NADPH dehydrogenase [Bacillota bacterium]
MSKLFQDFTLKGLTLKNRIMMSPMCMYSAGDDGRPTDWHFVHAAGAKMAVQLAHAGRKCAVPGERIVAPTSLHWSDEYPVPAELTPEEIRAIAAAFGRAARRAVAAGYDAVEVHAAHGYLIHEFLSPLSNQRTDQYGGTRENRVRFLREVLE